MKELSEEDLQNMVHGIMPQLIKQGFVEPMPKDALSDFGILIPRGKLIDGLNTIPQLSYDEFSKKYKF